MTKELTAAMLGRIPDRDGHVENIARRWRGYSRRVAEMKKMKTAMG
jgi:hypothetical protein